MYEEEDDVCPLCKKPIEPMPEHAALVRDVQDVGSVESGPRVQECYVQVHFACLARKLGWVLPPGNLR